MLLWLSATRFAGGFPLAVRLMVEAISSEKTWRALFRPVLREKICGSCTRQRPANPTQPICGGVWAQKSTSSESNRFWTCAFLTFKNWDAVVKEYGIYLSFLFLLGKQSSSQSMYSSGVIFPAEHSSRLTRASYFHFLKSFFLIWLTFTRAE